jgi:hypothetical protein
MIKRTNQVEAAGGRIVRRRHFASIAAASSLALSAGALVPATSSLASAIRA